MKNMNPGPESRYPLDAFPEELREVVLEAAYQTRVAEELSGTMVMAAVSLAGQDLADIRMTYGGVVPCQLIAIALISSGERKTGVTKKVFRGVFEFDAQCREEWLQTQAEYDVEHRVWQIRQKAMEAALAKVANEDDETIAAAEDNLREILKKEPKLPPAPERLLKDCTPDALLWHLHAVYPSVAFISDEGGNFLNGRATSQLPLLNSIWDASSITVTRKNSPSFVVQGARMTAAILIQFGAFEEFKLGRGASARDNGFFARALMCAPGSTLGLRQDTTIEPPDSLQLNKFSNRIIEMLKAGHMARLQGGTKRPVLELSPDAKMHLLDFGNHIETQLRPGGYFREVGDAASKTVENAVRMAGLFHLFLNHKGLVNKELVQRACAIAEWHLFEFRRLFTALPEVPLSIKDPMDLDESLRRQFHQFGRSQYTRSSLQAYAPSALRKSRSRLIAATETLIQFGVMARYQQPGSRSFWLTFNPQAHPYNPGPFNH